MQKLRNIWSGIKALVAVLVVGAVMVAAPLLGGLLAIVGALFIVFVLFLEYFSDEPEE